MSYCIYLRKSRKDLEAEQHGEGETLARHENALLSLAKKRNLIIGSIYREVVSGDTIAARPVMQQLLKEVESGVWDGVLVMEVERLARGDTIDQGVVQRAFQYSNTLIVTPIKTYDPADEFDQEYFEFGLFMSRREYKTIKRRMQNGRYAAVREGKWPFNVAPFGWKRIKLIGEKGWTLEPDETEAPVVRLIFQLFTGQDRIGVTAIKHYLNGRKIVPRKGDRWTESSILGILTNIVHDKRVGIGHRKCIRKIEDGVPVTVRPRSEYEIDTEGRQPRLIDHEIFMEAQSYIGNGNPKLPESYGVKNPLSGIIICSECKHRMYRRPASSKKEKKTLAYDLLMCKTDQCPTVGSPLELVERQLYAALSDWVAGYRLEAVTPKSLVPEKESLLHNAIQERDTLTQQNDHLHDLLEQGVYDIETFLKRSQNLQERLRRASETVKKLEKDLENEKERDSHIHQFLPSCESLLEHYWDLSVQERNKALKLLIESVEYKKTARNKRGEKDIPSFELTIKPRIPRV